MDFEQLIIAHFWAAIRCQQLAADPERAEIMHRQMMVHIARIANLREIMLDQPCNHR